MADRRTFRVAAFMTRVPAVVSGLGALALIVACSGCFTYSAPRGVHEALEHDLGSDLSREFGLKLGPISTRFAASFVHDSDDDFLKNIHTVKLAVYERGASHGGTRHPIEPGQLGVAGWSKVVDTRDGEDQVLVFAKPGGDEIREMLVVAIDDDEVTVARLTGHLTAALAANFVHDGPASHKADK